MPPYLLQVFVINILVTSLVPKPIGAEGIQIFTIPVGSNIIDLNSPEKDRVVRTLIIIHDFDLEDQFFLLKIVNYETKHEVKEFKILVQSNALKTRVNFGKMRTYIVTDQALSQKEINSGNFIMQVVARNGNVLSSMRFSVINSFDQN